VITSGNSQSVERPFIGRIGEIIVAAIQVARAIARRTSARHRQRQRARETYEVLRRLDDRTLRDLGFERSEIASVAAEIAGRAERARVRTRTGLGARVERDPV